MGRAERLIGTYKSLAQLLLVLSQYLHTMLTFTSKPNMIFVIEERMEIIPSEFFSLDIDAWGSQLQAPWPACRCTEEGELTFRKVDATEPKPQENQGKGKEGAGISPGVSPALRDTNVMFFLELWVLFCVLFLFHLVSCFNLLRRLEAAR